MPATFPDPFGIGPGGLKRINGLDEIMSDEGFDIGGRRKSENQNGRIDTGTPQRKGLGHPGHPQGVGAALQGLARNLHQPVPVGVGLDRHQQARFGPGDPPQLAGIGGNSLQIDFSPDERHVCHRSNFRSKKYSRLSPFGPLSRFGRLSPFSSFKYPNIQPTQPAQRTQPAAVGGLQHFDGTGHRYPSAATQGCQAETLTALLQAMYQGHHDPGAGRTDRVAQTNTRAVDVGNLALQAEFPFTSDVLGGKGLIDLHQFEIRDL